MTAAVRRPDPEALAKDIAEATAANSRGRPSVAARHFQRVLDGTDGAAAGAAGPRLGALRARALLGLASSVFEVGGDLARSLELLDQAEDVARRAGALHLVPAVRNNRALLLLRTGETALALRAFDAAAELIDTAEPFDRACILLNRGSLHLEGGDLVAARADLLRSAQVSADSGDRLLEFKARHNLGFVEFLAGNLPRALADIATAAELDPGGRHGIVLLDQARILREAGLGRDALASLDAATELFRRDRLVQDLGETELAKAEVALTAGDPVAARRSARSALRHFTRRQNLRWQRKAELAVIASELALNETSGARGRSRRFLQLAERARRLSSTCRAEGRRDLARAADLLQAQGLLAAAQPNPVLPSLSLRRSDPLSVRLQLRQLRARAAQARGRDSLARQEIRAGLTELSLHQSSAGSLDLRTAGAVHGVALARLDLALSLRHGRPWEVFASIERGRAVSTRLTPVRPPGDPETAALLSSLRQVEESARLLSGEAGRDADLAQLRARAAMLQQQVRARAWRREGQASAPTAADLADVRRALADAGAELVSFVQHEGRWLGCVAGRGSVTVHDLAPVSALRELTRRIVADLDALALNALPEPLRRTIAASLASDLALVDDLLLTPLPLTGHALVLCPAGPLALLPWPALPSQRGRPLVVTPSATSWLASRATKRHQGGRRRVAAVAGPGLHRAAAEATEVAGIWGAEPALVGAGATVAAVAALLGAGSDVVHVAAHGLHQTESPLFSSVRLADGPLFAYELDAAGGMAGLVVLSACEVGLSTIRPGEEALGLTSVLLRLGVTSVVAGVSRVADGVAADVMGGLHRRLAGGADTATALAETLAMLPEPAPFVCFGSSWAS
ncbi:MAG TPA: CHAT domain-containing tetratricopeptide repeat protein [Dermatophilaceae bacterium]|nr:CHAT domain-containing tetratricopeptide repeat protein [Dermatophilaceae bacterium]